MKKTDQDNRDKNQAEQLRKTLKSFGINKMSYWMQ